MDHCAFLTVLHSPDGRKIVSEVGMAKVIQTVICYAVSVAGNENTAYTLDTKSQTFCYIK